MQLLKLIFLAAHFSIMSIINNFFEMELNGKTKVETSVNLEENNNNNTNSNIERPKSANVVADDKKCGLNSILNSCRNFFILFVTNIYKSLFIYMHMC